MDMHAIAAVVTALGALVTNILVVMSNRPGPVCVTKPDTERELAERMAWEEIHEIERVYAP